MYMNPAHEDGLWRISPSSTKARHFAVNKLQKQFLGYHNHNTLMLKQSQRTLHNNVLQD